MIMNVYVEDRWYLQTLLFQVKANTIKASKTQWNLNQTQQKKKYFKISRYVFPPPLSPSYSRLPLSLWLFQKKVIIAMISRRPFFMEIIAILLWFSINRHISRKNEKKILTGFYAWVNHFQNIILMFKYVHFVGNAKIKNSLEI